jgi:AraC family transcriptional activator of pobA
MIKQLQIKDKTDGADLIKILPFRKEVKKTSPHKHNNYFEIIYLSGGGGVVPILCQYPGDKPVLRQQCFVMMLLVVQCQKK